MSLNKSLIAGTAALAISLGASLGALRAQEAAPAPTPAPGIETPAAAAPDLGEDKLKSFATAFLEVNKLTQQYQPQISAAGTPEDQQRLRQEAGQKMVEAVNGSEGISVDEYNSIIQAAQTDPELAQRINGHITEAAGASPAAQPPAAF